MACPCLDVNVVAIFVAILVGVFTFYKWKHSYWKKKNLPHPKTSIPFGTMENPFRRSKALGVWIQDNYNELKAQGCKHAGLYNFTEPVYLVIDPEYVKNVMQKDFQHFVERGIYYNEKDDPLSAHLFTIGGPKWRNLRTKLTPTFTSGKMKMMFDTLVKCTGPMKKVMDELTEEGKPIDIKEIVGRFTTDIIGSCAFGLECNSFENPDAEFRMCGKKFFERSIFQIFTNLLFMSKPSIGRWLGLRSLPKAVSEFFFKIVKDTVEYREKNDVSRKDMLQLLIELKNKVSEDGEHKNDGTCLTIEEVAAQCLIFFIAGFETSSTTMSYALFELAQNPEIQQKVRDEVNEVYVKHGRKMTYEAVSDLHYMTQVVEETLRKYPPVAMITRQCVKDYKVPDTDVVIEKGTAVFISPLGLHHDPEYFPQPEKFDPDRFSPENKSSIPHFTYIPFGEGPRICIGARFGMMQAKAGLAVLVKNYEITLNSKTILPLEIDPNSLVVNATKNTIWFNSRKL